MASRLSPSAVYRIMFFIIPDNEKDDYIKRDPKLLYYADVLERVNDTWRAIYKLYMSSEPAQPLDYLNSLELALALKDDVDDEDVRAIFAQGKPLHFWSCPRLLVSKIVQVSSRRFMLHLDTRTAFSKSNTGFRNVSYWRSTVRH